MKINWFTEKTECGSAKVLIRPVQQRPFNSFIFTVTVIHGKNHYVFDHFAEYYERTEHWARLNEARGFAQNFVNNLEN